MFYEFNLDYGLSIVIGWIGLHIFDHVFEYCL